MQTQLPTSTVANEGEVLTHGVELVRCPICQTALVADEQCPRGCRVDHRGRRQSSRRGLARLSETPDRLLFEPHGLEALALAGELRGEVVA